MDLRRQLAEDKATTQAFLDEGVVIVSREHPEKAISMVQILHRLADAGPRQRGVTKDMLLQLRDLIPGDFEVGPTSSKMDIVEELLGKLTRPAQEDNEHAPEIQPEDIPEGWDDDEVVPDVDTIPPTPLLLFRRDEYRELSRDEILVKLMDEQETLRQKKLLNDGPTLRYAKDNLQEMAKKTIPLPADVSDRVVWFLYESQLRKVISQITTDTPTGAVTGNRGGGDVPDLIEVSNSDSSYSSSEDSSDSDLDTYSQPFSHKHFKNKKTKRSRKRSKKKKKRKKKRRKRKKRRRSSSSSSSSSSDSASDAAVAPNGRRVSAAAYDATHYERLKEFKEGYDEWVDEAGPADWPEDSALEFISKKFARPGTKFANKREGVKHKFTSKDQVDFAKTKTRQIYGWANDVANLRLERHAQLSKAHRRVKGASAAKRARIKQQAGTFKRASVREEQTLVAKIGVCCDLVCLGKKSWSDYHDELKLGGQREAVIESSGGGSRRQLLERHGKRPKPPQSNLRERDVRPRLVRRLLAIGAAVRIIQGSLVR